MDLAVKNVVELISEYILTGPYVYYWRHQDLQRCELFRNDSFTVSGIGERDYDTIRDVACDGPQTQ